MKILTPMELNFPYDHDNEQAGMMVEAQILNYTLYLAAIADTWDIEITIATIYEQSPALSKEENILFSRHFPFFHVQVNDEELVGEFVCSSYTAELYESFRKWVAQDILFYIKSKQLCRELDSKLPERQRLRQGFKDKI